MNSIFQEYLDDFVVVYLDDILVMLYAKLNKCGFLETSVEYLGHVVGNNSIKPDDRKTKAILDWEKPKNSKDVMKSKSSNQHHQGYLQFLPQRTQHFLN